MSEFGQNNETARVKVEAYIAERFEWLSDGVEAVTGNREDDPIAVFPEPTEPRANAVIGESFTEHEGALREVAARFGVGPEQDAPGTAEVRIVEGGKPWKIEAEAAIGAGVASTIIFAGSANRKIGADEKAYLAEKHGVDAEADLTEFDVAQLLASKLDNFQTLEQPEVMPFGYQLDADNTLTEEATGQLVKIGTTSGKPVMVLRVDREDYVDEEGKNKYRYQPDSAKLMKFVSGVLRASGDETSGVGLDTSNTYASRAIDTVRAGYEDGRFFDVGMYGRATLRGLVEETQVFADGIVKVTAETPANQIPGELHTMAVKLQALKAVIGE